MSKYGSGLIGLDIKPRRKSSRFQRNRYINHYTKWLFPVILGLVILGILAMAGIR